MNILYVAIGLKYNITRYGKIAVIYPYIRTIRFLILNCPLIVF